MSDFRLEKVTDRRGFALTVYLRTMVYIVEQNCPPLVDFDETDNTAQPYLGWAGDTPVCACRTFEVTQGVLKIGRIVTLKENRGKGYASQMLGAIIDDARRNPVIKSIKMSAQDHAIGLYQKLGFETFGDGFIEADIPHHMMKLDLKEAA